MERQLANSLAPNDRATEERAIIRPQLRAQFDPRTHRRIVAWMVKFSLQSPQDNEQEYLYMHKILPCTVLQTHKPCSPGANLSCSDRCSNPHRNCSLKRLQYGVLLRMQRTGWPRWVFTPFLKACLNYHNASDCTLLPAACPGECQRGHRHALPPQ